MPKSSQKLLEEVPQAVWDEWASDLTRQTMMKSPMWQAIHLARMREWRAAELKFARQQAAAHHAAWHSPRAWGRRRA